jgi:hypothetical protein
VGNHIAIVDKARGGDTLKLNLDAYNIGTGEINLIKPEEKLWRTLCVMV